jgi:hypothetical protein
VDSQSSPSPGGVLDRWLRHLRDSDIQLRADLDAMSRTVSALQTQLRDLDDRFTEVLASYQRLRDPHALSAADLLRHEAIAADLERLFDDMWRAVQATPGLKVGSTGTRARAMAAAVRTLFPPTGADQTGGPDQVAGPSDDLTSVYGTHKRGSTLVREFRQRAGALYDRIDAVGTADVFDYTYHDGPVDPETQRTWKSCDPDGVVLFVVRPAYRVRNHIYLRQEVFTAEHSGAAPADAADGEPTVEDG